MLTQEEIDYMRYVDGLGEDKNHTSSQATIAGVGKQSKLSNYK